MVVRSEWSIYLEVTRKFLKELLLLFPFTLWSILNWFLWKKRKNVIGQLALITGGSDGIGSEIAYELANQGCNIAIVDEDITNGQQVVEQIRKRFKVEAQFFKCKVKNSEDVKRLRSDIKNSLGTVDILVNNAEISMPENSLFEGDDEIYRNCMELNSTSWFWTTRTFLPDMIKQRRGHIVGITSALVECPVPNGVSYISTKYANKGFLEALREEMCFYGFDKFINTSIAYLEHAKSKDTFLHPLLPNVNLQEDSKVIVDGILKNIHTIRTSTFWMVMRFIINNLLPRYSKTRIYREVMIRSDKRDEFIENKLRNSNLLEDFLKVNRIKYEF